jgi:hypothetical protein
MSECLESSVFPGDSIVNALRLFSCWAFLLFAFPQSESRAADSPPWLKDVQPDAIGFLHVDGDE